MFVLENLVPVQLPLVRNVLLSGWNVWERYLAGQIKRFEVFEIANAMLIASLAGLADVAKVIRPDHFRDRDLNDAKAGSPDTKQSKGPLQGQPRVTHIANVRCYIGMESCESSCHR